MRITTAMLAAACLSGCALYNASPEERSEFRALTSTATGIPENDIAISNTHGFMLNTAWSANTTKGHFYCSRDLNGDVSCRRD
jgi:hypothetical protein